MLLIERILLVISYLVTMGNRTSFKKGNSARFIHGEARPGHQSRLYSIWVGMNDRVKNPNSKSYKYYGGRGISVCEEWESSINFILWAKNNGYSDNLVIDRIDVNGDYCPENCRFVTPHESVLNRRNRNDYGVYASGNKFYVVIRRNGKIIKGGYFNNKKDALLKRDEIVGDYLIMNFDEFSNKYDFNDNR